MTLRTNARLAGFTFLFYIAAGITSMVLFNRATRGEGIAAKLASIAQHTETFASTRVLILLTSLAALVLVRDVCRRSRATRIPISPCWA